MQETPSNSNPVLVHFTSTRSRYVSRQVRIINEPGSTSGPRNKLRADVVGDHMFIPPLPLTTDSGDHSDEYSDADIYDGFGPSRVFVPLGTHQPLHEWIHSNGHRIGPFNLSSPAHPYEVQFAMYTFGKDFLLRYYWVQI